MTLLLNLIDIAFNSVLNLDNRYQNIHLAVKALPAFWLVCLQSSRSSPIVFPLSSSINFLFTRSLRETRRQEGTKAYILKEKNLRKTGKEYSICNAWLRFLTRFTSTNSTAVFMWYRHLHRTAYYRSAPLDEDVARLTFYTFKILLHPSSRI